MVSFWGSAPYPRFHIQVDQNLDLPVDTVPRLDSWATPSLV